jgi:hypothetical protein
MCSIKKARKRLKKVCRWPGVADAAVAVVAAAEPAPGAAHAAAVAVDAESVGEAAARRGARAAGARPDHPLAQVNAIFMAGLDKVDPANVFGLIFSCLLWRRGEPLARPPRDSQVGLRPIEKCRPADRKGSFRGQTDRLAQSSRRNTQVSCAENRDRQPQGQAASPPRQEHRAVRAEFHRLRTAA